MMTIFDLPTAAAELRRRLEASGIHVAGPTTAYQWDEIGRLLALHGPQVLAAAAVREWKADHPIRTLQGFIRCWQRLPRPIVEQRCEIHDRLHAGTCPGCRADQLAGEA